MFLSRDSLSDRHDVVWTVALRDDDVQNLLHHDLHQSDHIVSVPDGVVC